MAAIKDDILALRTLAATLLPATTKFYLQDVPETPAAGSLSIRIANQTSTELSRVHVQSERIYQLIFFGKTNMDVIDAVDKLRLGTTYQPTIETGARQIMLGAFSMSQPFKTEGGLHAAICTVTLTSFENRNAPVHPKIGRVVLEFNITDLQDSNTFNDVTISGLTFDELAEKLRMDEVADADIGRSAYTQDIK